MKERTKKFWSKNEKELLSKLGFTPAKASGAGWIEKEDGENEDSIAQLKSTDAESYRVHLLDLQKLEYHAAVSKKIGLFIIQFLQSDSLYVMVNVNEFDNLKRVILGKPLKKNKTVLVNDKSDFEETKIIKSSNKAKADYYREREEKWQNKKKRK